MQRPARGRAPTEMDTSTEREPELGMPGNGVGGLRGATFVQQYDAEQAGGSGHGKALTGQQQRTRALEAESHRPQEDVTR